MIKICVICKEKYVQSQGGGVLCKRDECRKEYQRQYARERYVKRKKFLRKCVICHKEFTTFKTNAKACRNRTCKRKYVNERNKKNYQNRDNEKRVTRTSIKGFDRYKANIKKRLLESDMNSLDIAECFHGVDNLKIIKGKIGVPTT